MDVGSISAILLRQVFAPPRGKRAGSFPEQQLAMKPTVDGMLVHCRVNSTFGGAVTVV